jgi:PST family polysaccharide transporter
MISDWLRIAPRRIRDRVEGRSRVQAVLGNISWLSADRIVRLGVGLIVGLWVARYLGPGQYGALNFASAFVALFGPLAVLGLDSVVIRDLAAQPDQERRTLGTAFILKLVGGVTSGILAILVFALSRPEDTRLQWLVVIFSGGVLFQSMDVVDFWFQAQVRSKHVVLARNASFLILAVARVIMILSHASLAAFAWATLAELALCALGLLIIYTNAGRSVLSWIPQMKRAREVLRDSWPLFLAGISIALYMRLDQVMIGYLLDESSVGIYSVAIRLVEIWYFLPTAIAASVLPGLIQVRSENEQLYKTRLQTVYDVMGALSLVLAAGISLLSGLIIGILYGQAYAAAAPVLSIYAWGTVPVFLGVASSQHFLVENRNRVSLFRTFVGLVINVILNLILIPVWGPAGAAFASLVSQCAVVVSIWFVPGAREQVTMIFRALNPFRLAQVIFRS